MQSLRGVSIDAGSIHILIMCVPDLPSGCQTISNSNMLHGFATGIATEELPAVYCVAIAAVSRAVRMVRAEYE